MYIADTGNNRIQVLNSDLTFSRSFGKEGSGKGQFDSPNGIACDSTGKVYTYVADTNNQRVQVFRPEGNFLRMFEIGMVGQRRAHLPAPYCMAIDASDIIYLSILAFGECIDCICLFTSEGQFVTSFGRGFEDPRGLAVDNSGVLYVCDSKCVYLF